jgi:hypothetical protein
MTWNPAGSLGRGTLRVQVKNSDDRVMCLAVYDVRATRADAPRTGGLHRPGPTRLLDRTAIAENFE